MKQKYVTTMMVNVCKTKKKKYFDTEITVISFMMAVLKKRNNFLKIHFLKKETWSLENMQHNMSNYFDLNR